jgi:hypothetical protein
MIASMPMLAGIPIAPELVRELTARLDEPTATVLEQALDAQRAVVALTITTVSEFSERSRTAPTGWPSSAFCSASMSGGCEKDSPNGARTSPFLDLRRYERCPAGERLATTPAREHLEAAGVAHTEHRPGRTSYRVRQAGAARFDVEASGVLKSWTTSSERSSAR